MIGSARESRAAWRVLFAVAVVAGCAGAPAPTQPPPRAPAAPRLDPASPPGAGQPALAPAVVEPGGPPLAGADDVALWLPAFYAALRELELGERRKHVRVLWFGDSHTAADFWSQAVREPLQQRFGSGGAGLVLVGLKRYRHGLALLETAGRWRRIPRSPAATRPRDDGVLGLSGLGAVPVSGGATAELRLRRSESWADEEVDWTVYYRLLGSEASFRIGPGGADARRVRAGDGDAKPSGIASFRWHTRGVRELVLDAFEGDLELFGVTVERHAPGVVVDTLGINGARAATPLSWDREAWIDQIEDREPSLAIFAYGTNEVGDSAPARRYEGYYAELVERLRSAAPRADCLLLGPTDRASPDWETNPRVLQIDAAQRKAARELGCGFFSAFDAMGGAGSLRRWAFENPPAARRDRVHLTPRGYERLGKTLAARLLESYETVYPTPDDSH